MNRQRFLLPALLALTAARFLCLALHPLSEVERHVVECSQHEGLWQQALGPVLPLLVKLGTSIFGVNSFGVRCLAPLLMLAASWLLWKVARGVFDSTTASWTLVIFQVTPAVNLAAVTMTQTTLGIVSSAALLAALRHALHRDRRHHLQWWLLGASLALAILVDWRLGMLAVSCAAGMALTQRGRRALLKWPVLPVLVLCVGAVVTLLLVWNSKHGWPVFAPLPGTVPRSLWEITRHVLLAVSPLLLVGYAWSLVESLRHRPMEYAVAFLTAFVWPLILVDAFCWPALPWPLCGLGAWIPPAAMLLAHHAMNHGMATPRLVIWARWLMLLAAAGQSCVMVQRLVSGGVSPA